MKVCRGHRRIRQLLLFTATTLLLAAALAGSSALWMVGKAQFAQLLLERAWSRSQYTSTSSTSPTPELVSSATAAGKESLTLPTSHATRARPWPWADIAPVARLDVPAAGISQFVLQDASGEAMAFGPGLLSGSPERAARSVVALGGHRDSHLAFLEDIEPGAALALEDRHGVRHAYRLASKQVIDSRDGPLSVPTGQPALILITCWPFEATQTGGPLRLVALALPVPG